MDGDTFIFSDENLVSSSFSAFQDMKNTGELVDFKVTIKDRCFFGHRIILAAAVPYLREVFTSSTSEISLEQIDPEVFEDIINYAYSGKIKISIGNVESLLVASQILHLTKVHEVCVKYAAIRINLSNVFTLRNFAGNIKSLRLAVACDRCILGNFEEFVFSRHNEFLQLPFPYLKEIISRADLNVKKEEKVFETIVKWVKAFPQERRIFFPELLGSVRITQISTDYLVDTIAFEELVISSLQCMNLVEATKNYHLSPRKRSGASGLGCTDGRKRSCYCLYGLCCSRLGSFIDMYDLEKGMWITLSHMGNQNFDHIVGFDGKLYMFQNFRTDGYMFDVNTLKRESVVAPQGFCQQIILHNNSLYAFEGNKIFCYNHNRKQWQVKTENIKSRDAGIASLEEYIYITGGWSAQSFTSCKKYNPDTGREIKIAPMLSGKSNHCCTGLNQRLYVCNFIETEVYNPVTDQWSSIASVKHLKNVISLTAFKGKLYALGEEEAEIYDPKTNTWTVVAPRPSACKFTKFVTIPEETDTELYYLK